MAANDHIPVDPSESQDPASSPVRKGSVAAKLGAAWQTRSGLLQALRRSRGGQVAAGLALFAIASTAVWLAVRQPAATPAEKLRQALELLRNPHDQDSRQEARALALELHRAGYRDPDFSGGVDFVLGIVAYRTAREADENRKERHYLLAAKMLRECERRALIDKYRPEWSYALGVSLHELGSSSSAMPLLREALATFPPGRRDAAMRLIEISLDQKETKQLQTALTLSAELLRDKTLTRQQRDRVSLNTSQIHLALKQYVQAQAALNRMSNVETGSQGARLFRARTRMAAADALTSSRAAAVFSAVVDAVVRLRAAREYRAAQRDLLPVATSRGLETTFPRQARYLMGICARKLAELDAGDGTVARYDSAISQFEQTARDFPQTHEAVAASLRSGDLLRLSGRDEESLQAYRRAIQWSSRGEEFHNRWISLAEMRAILVRAWNAWMDRGSAAVAIDLSAMMPPIVSEVHAQELTAIAHAEWAKRLAKRLQTRPAAEQKSQRPELLRRRRLTGDSYAKLALLVKATSRYAHFAKLSAEYYHRGHDFANALKQMNEFINTRPQNELARAIVLRGRVLMDLDRLKQARDDFQHVRDAYPTDPATFEASYLLGRCELELGEPDKAAAIWKGILKSNALAPAAAEWRLSLFSLGRHHFHTAKLLKEKADRLRPDHRKAAVAIRDQAAQRWNSSVTLLEEYLGRYPHSPETNEARFIVARALQYRAGIEGEKRDEGEVENVRQEHRRRMNELLIRAQRRYRLLQSDLLKLEERDRLDDAGQSLLRDCYFEIAHCSYSLEEFDKAIIAYTNAANRYSKDAQELLAYLQMANCNQRLGDAAEAMSLIIQAEVILKQLPDAAFTQHVTGLSRKEWAKWLQWARQQRAALLD